MMRRNTHAPRSRFLRVLCDKVTPLSHMQDNKATFTPVSWGHKNAMHYGSDDSDDLCWIYKLITNTRFPCSIWLSAPTAAYLRLKGDEMLLVFVIYFSVYYICYVHHWGQEKNIVLSATIRENKQTGTSDCLLTNNGINHTVAFFFFLYLSLKISMFKRKMKFLKTMAHMGVRFKRQHSV